MSKPKATTKPADGKTDGKVSLATAQETAKASLKSGRAGLADTVAAMLKVGKGQPIPVEQIAAAVGPTTTRADIRHTFQRVGLSARRQAVIEAPGGLWVWLLKSKGQNSYLVDKAGIDHSKQA